MAFPSLQFIDCLMDLSPTMTSQSTPGLDYDMILLSRVVISVHRSIWIFSLRLGHEALSPPLHAFSSETPNSIINSSLFLERLRTRICARACARPGRSHYLTWARCRHRKLQSRSARSRRKLPALWVQYTHRGRGPCRLPIHHNKYHHRQSRSGHRWGHAAGGFR